MNEQKKYDAILVAGESKYSYKVRNQYKALLEIDDRYCIQYVIEALQLVSMIDDIYIIGPMEKLTTAFKSAGINLDYPKKVHILEQKDNLLENVWHAFISSLSPLDGHDDTVLEKMAEKAVLVVPCDSPLITPQEVEHFISNCDLDSYDYILGLTPQKNMEYFYPQGNRPGIKMAYLHMKEKNYRINNLHMVRPVRVRSRIHINKMYEYRYQKRIANMILLVLYLLRIQPLKRIKLLLGLQFSLISAKLDLPLLTALFKKWVPRHELEKAISQILQTRFTSLAVPFPGAALDIDNDEAYEALKCKFDPWRTYLNKL